MGRKSKLVRVTEEELPKEELPQTLTDDLHEENLLKEQLEIDGWLTDFKARFTDQPAKVQVEKFENGEWAICRRYPLATFDHELVRTEFGGGTFRAVLIDAKGRFVTEGRMAFKFAESIIKPAAPPANPLTDPAVLLIIESLKSQKDQFMDIMKAMLAANGGGGKSDLGQLVTALKGLQEMSPKEKPMENFKETLGIMKLVKEITGDSDGESKGGLLSDIKDFLEVWPSVREKFGELKPPQAPAPSPSIPERTPIVADPLTQKIVSLVPHFVEAAKKAEPVDKWADFLLDKFDNEIIPILTPMLKKKYGPLVKDEDEAYDMVLRYAEDATERAEAIAKIPPLAPYKEWCNRVIDEAIQLAKTDAESNPVAEAITGNGTTPPAGVEG